MTTPFNIRFQSCVVAAFGPGRLKGWIKRGKRSPIGYRVIMRRGGERLPLERALRRRFEAVRPPVRYDIRRHVRSVEQKRLRMKQRWLFMVTCRICGRYAMTKQAQGSRSRRSSEY